MGPPHSPMTALPTETYKEIYARAGHVWGKVISLVGKFDLDPNRALDLILDVLSSNLATHHTFFLALLSFSPWAASYQRPLDRSVEETPMDIDPSTPAPVSYKGKSLDDVLRIAEENSLNGGDIMDSNSARVLSQVLGFKFACYQVRHLSSSHIPVSHILSDSRNRGHDTKKLVSHDGYPYTREVHIVGRYISPCMSTFQSSYISFLPGHSLHLPKRTWI